MQVVTLSAQEKKMNMADYEKRKKEFIQREAGLSKAEADKYFPLNSELTKKKFELHRIHREKVQRIKENSNISDEEYKKMLEDDVELKMKEAALEKEYAPKFEKVLTPEKLYRAQQAERDFIQKEVINFRNNRNNRNNNRNR
jgi:Spy/CpxP family protein refolding chaperone